MYYVFKNIRAFFSSATARRADKGRVRVRDGDRVMDLVRVRG